MVQIKDKHDRIIWLNVKPDVAFLEDRHRRYGEEKHEDWQAYHLILSFGDCIVHIYCNFLQVCQDIASLKDGEYLVDIVFAYSPIDRIGDNIREHWGLER